MVSFLSKSRFNIAALEIVLLVLLTASTTTNSNRLQICLFVGFGEISVCACFLSFVDNSIAWVIDDHEDSSGHSVCMVISLQMLKCTWS